MAGRWYERIVRVNLTCSCPSTDGVECLQMRYGLNLDEALLEPCDCDCHKPENQPVVVYEQDEEDMLFELMEQESMRHMRGIFDE